MLFPPIFSQKLFENKSIDKDLKDLEETFRDPLILLKSVKEMQLKQQNVKNKNNSSNY